VTLPEGSDGGEMSENFTPIKSVPSHISPPTDGITYTQVDRQWYRVLVGEYTGPQIREAVGISEDRQLWLLIPGENDKLIDEDVLAVPLYHSGRRFYTTPRFINGG
jgi:hypothetical protein